MPLWEGVLLIVVWFVVKLLLTIAFWILLLRIIINIIKKGVEEIGTKITMSNMWGTDRPEGNEATRK